MATCKDDCEALMSAVLPVAERMLTERTLRPFGCTLGTDDSIVQVGGGAASAEQALLDLEAAFHDGATRGELKATAVVLSNETNDAVMVRLDHREEYSIVVTFPYRFTETGQLVIDEPFAGDGAHAIFG